MPTRRSPDEKVQVNLQTGTCAGMGARNVLHQPGGHPSFLNTLILTVVRAALFIHSSL